jgi:hypothetical protein
MSIFIESIIHDKSNNVSAVLSMYASFNIVMTVKAKKKSTWNKLDRLIVVIEIRVCLVGIQTFMKHFEYRLFSQKMFWMTNYNSFMRPFG